MRVGGQHHAPASLPSTCVSGGRVDSRASMDGVEKRKKSLAVVRIQTPDSPACSIVAISVVVAWL